LSPAARTLQALRASNFIAGLVERFVAPANCRIDLFGAIDIIACRRGEPRVLGIQATTLSHLSDRLAKARESAELAVWLTCARFEVWAWFLNRAGRWRFKRAELVAGDVVPRIGAAPARRRRRADQPGLFDALAGAGACTEVPKQGDLEPTSSGPDGSDAG
jgi:hypothetical protein